MTLSHQLTENRSVWAWFLEIAFTSLNCNHLFNIDIVKYNRRMKKKEYQNGTTRILSFVWYGLGTYLLCACVCDHRNNYIVRHQAIESIENVFKNKKEKERKKQPSWFSV